MTRLFVDMNEISEEYFTLDSENSHYIASVLRMREGEELTLVSGNRTEYLCEVSSVGKKEVTLKIVSSKENETEPKSFITLYQSVSKGERMDLTIQKSVELGVSRIVPVYSERVISRNDKASKIDRWQKIALEAARQSQRGMVPEVTEVVSFKEALKQAAETNDIVLFPWEEEKGQTLKEALTNKELSRVAVFIGPEGGYSEAEAALAVDNGAKAVTLGKRILRTETAGPAVLSMLLFLTEL